MAVPTPTNDPAAAAHNPPITKHDDAGRLHRAALFLTHFLHLVCCMIVMGIAAHFILKRYYTSGDTVNLAAAALSALIFIVALARSIVGVHRSVLPAFMLLLSCLWLAASILAAIQYKDTRCTDFDVIWDIFDAAHCSLTRTLLGFSFLALLTCLFATLLEAALWRHRRQAKEPSIEDRPDPSRDMSMAPPVPQTAV